jgi:hypothetical protein
MMAAPELSLLRSGVQTKLFKEKPVGGEEHPVLNYFDERADLHGLPVLRGEDCRQADHRAGNFNDTARKLRALLGSIENRVNYPYSGDWRTEFRQGVDQLPPEQVAPLLLQMLQCERPNLRRLLIEYARANPRPQTTEVLAHRVVYDPDAAVRQMAFHALVERTPDSARPVLLAALRHPWPAIADRAATALTALHDKAAVPALLDQLDQPDPAAPFEDDQGNRLVHEVVRINHGHNCQLCHAPSWEAKDPARVAVPAIDQPLPPSFSTQYYAAGEMLVRADVTYLRQDFSMTLPVADPGPWPREQRFDFFVRTHAAPAEPPGRRHQPAENRHRVIIVRALREITGKDFGEKADNWRFGLKSARIG